jgi:hypothetical protein
MVKTQQTCSLKLAAESSRSSQLKAQAFCKAFPIAEKALT